MEPFRRIEQVDGQNAIMLKNDSSLRAGNLHPPGVSGISRRAGLQHAERAVRKLEESNRSIFRFNRMKPCPFASLDAHHLSKQPQH